MMNKVQTLLVVAIGVLTITCIGLSVAVANANSKASTTKGDKRNNRYLTLKYHFEGGETSGLVQTTQASIASSESSVRQDGKPWVIDPRLPKHLIPLHYDLWLHPNLVSGLFKG